MFVPLFCLAKCPPNELLAENHPPHKQISHKGLIASDAFSFAWWFGSPLCAHGFVVSQKGMNRTKGKSPWTIIVVFDYGRADQ